MNARVVSHKEYGVPKLWDLRMQVEKLGSQLYVCSDGMFIRPICEKVLI